MTNHTTKLTLTAVMVILLGFGAYCKAAPFTPQGPFVQPLPGPLLPSVTQVPGKEFSDSINAPASAVDRDALGNLDFEQNIAWDGAGGVADTFDYTGSRLQIDPHVPDREVDAIANKEDMLFGALIDDRSQLLFSTDLDPNVRYELHQQMLLPAPQVGGIWATPAQIDVMNPPVDVDGLEVWAPAPDPNFDNQVPADAAQRINDFNGIGVEGADDANRYSLITDPFMPGAVNPTTGQVGARVSVLEYSTPGGITPGVSSPVIFTADVATAVAPLQQVFDEIIPLPPEELEHLIDVDALFMNDITGFQDANISQKIPSARMVFSIDPVTLTLPDGSVFTLFDGGEIFVWDTVPGSTATFLNHGGHTWDTAFNLMATYNTPSENLNALEAVSTIPEPATMMLGSLALLAIAGSRCIPRR
ncbi:MAG: PEP-CTERM sorting domain-containing protein [Bythopirellula sp.]